MMMRRSRRRRTLLALAAAVVLTSGPGCVRRRLTVRTNPPGALVSVDNQVIGTSPASTPFTYYGTREFRIERDGYRTETIRRRINPPWYQIPPLDFITDTLWPFEIRDERVIDLEMVPQQPEPVPAVLQRADQLRDQSRRGVVSALPAPETPVPPIPSAPLPSQGLPLGGVSLQ